MFKVTCESVVSKQSISELGLTSFNDPGVKAKLNDSKRKKLALLFNGQSMHNSKTKALSFISNVKQY